MTDFNVLVGADPELFVKEGDRFVSGHGMVDGTKANPLRVENGAVQVDGTALEFNIDPAANEDEFVNNLTSVMKQLGDMTGRELHAIPTATYGSEYMATLPEEALELGCDPDFNAYENGAANPRPDGNVDFRTGGGHVHIGWTKDMDVGDPGHNEACQMLVRELDITLGLASMLWDEDEKRRELYGKAGAYRVKPYGVEYRSLSNAWLRSETCMRFVYKAVQAVSQRLFEGKSFYNELNDIGRYAMDNNDLGLAKRILDHIGMEIPDELKLR